MRILLSDVIVLSGVLLLSACTNAYEERGICNYLGTCEMGLETHIDLNYCKELGSCDDGTDPTEYTVGGKASAKSDTTTSETSSGSGSDGSQ